MQRIYATVLLLLASIVLAGCGETAFEQATGKSQIRGINGLVETADVIFLIEETPISELSYKTATSQREYDNLSYTFSFDLPFPSSRRLASRTIDAIEDIEYTFIVAGPAANPEMILWERPAPDWTGTETVFDIGAGHVSNSVGEVDVYFAAPGTIPVLGDALGSLDFGGRIADRPLDGGEYEVVLTAKDDPANILFTSSTLILAPASSYTIVVFDADPSITAPVSVRLIDQSGSSLELGDVNFPPTAQFVNAAFGSGNLDVVADGDFVNRLVVDLPFGGVSPDVDIEQGPLTYSYLPTGSTTPLLDADLTVLRGTRSMVVIAGEVGDLQTIQLGSDRRGFSTLGRYRLTNASFNSQDIDFYFLEPGTTVDDRLPNIFGLEFADATNVAPQIARDFDLVVTTSGEKTILAGPEALTLNANDMVEIILLDTVDPNVAELLIFSNTNP
jgi:hypothetical protein